MMYLRLSTQSSQLQENTTSAIKTRFFLFMLLLLSVVSLAAQTNTFRSFGRIPKVAQIILAVEYSLVLLISFRDIFRTKRIRVLILDFCIIYAPFMVGTGLVSTGWVPLETGEVIPEHRPALEPKRKKKKPQVLGDADKNKAENLDPSKKNEESIVSSSGPSIQSHDGSSTVASTSVKTKAKTEIANHNNKNSLLEQPKTGTLAPTPSSTVSTTMETVTTSIGTVTGPIVKSPAANTNSKIQAEKLIEFENDNLFEVLEGLHAAFSACTDENEYVHLLVQIFYLWARYTSLHPLEEAKSVTEDFINYWEIGLQYKRKVTAHIEQLKTKKSAILTAKFTVYAGNVLDLLQTDIDNIEAVYISLFEAAFNERCYLDILSWARIHGEPEIVNFTLRLLLRLFKKSLCPEGFESLLTKNICYETATSDLLAIKDRIEAVKASMNGLSPLFQDVPEVQVECDHFVVELLRKSAQINIILKQTDIYKKYLFTKTRNFIDVQAFDADVASIQTFPYQGSLIGSAGMIDKLDDISFRAVDRTLLFHEVMSDFDLLSLEQDPFFFCNPLSSGYLLSDERIENLKKNYPITVEVPLTQADHLETAVKILKDHVAKMEDLYAKEVTKEKLVNYGADFKHLSKNIDTILIGGNFLPFDRGSVRQQRQQPQTVITRVAHGGRVRGRGRGGGGMPGKGTDVQVKSEAEKLDELEINRLSIIFDAITDLLHFWYSIFTRAEYISQLQPTPQQDGIFQNLQELTEMLKEHLIRFVKLFIAFYSGYDGNVQNLKDNTLSLFSFSHHIRPFPRPLTGNLLDPSRYMDVRTVLPWARALSDSSHLYGTINLANLSKDMNRFYKVDFDHPFDILHRLSNEEHYVFGSLKLVFKDFPAEYWERIESEILKAVQPIINTLTKKVEHQGLGGYQEYYRERTIGSPDDPLTGKKGSSGYSPELAKLIENSKEIDVRNFARHFYTMTFRACFSDEETVYREDEGCKNAKRLSILRNGFFEFKFSDDFRKAMELMPCIDPNKPRRR